MYKDNELKKDISEIKNELVSLKASIKILIDTLIINPSNFQNTTNSIENKENYDNVGKHTESNPEVENGESEYDQYLIDYYFINNKDLANALQKYNKEMARARAKMNFINFCFSVVKQIESIIEILLHEKLLGLDKNDKDIIEAYNILEKNI